MLTVYSGSSGKFCDGVSRRNFLKLGLAGAGLGLSDVLRLRALAGPTGGAPNKIKSVIMIFLKGGPSHLDMYDMKPDAPLEFRGEFQPIRTNVTGIEMCELLPEQAKLADKLAIVRSLQWFEPEQHEPSEVCTGFTKREHRPSFGSTVSRLYQGADPVLPHFVSVTGFYDNDVRPFEDAGYMGAAHRPFYPEGPGMENLRLSPELKLDRVGSRKQLLGSLDRMRRDVDARGEMAGMDSFTHQALDMVSSGKVYDAFDLSKEPESVKAKYGPKGLTFKYGDYNAPWDPDIFIRARRLAEAGVPVISLRVGSWDHHGGGTGDIFSGLRSQLPLYDRSIAGLISDIYERGLDKEVAVLIWGEFGRTPRINNLNGRDHWPDAGFALLSGGGMKMGQTIGATEGRGERPSNRPLKPQNVFATLYHQLGIDPAIKIPDLNGRPQYLLEDRDPISELL